jgi:hypothetical protein
MNQINYPTDNSASRQIIQQTNSMQQTEKLSPRKLIQQSNYPAEKLSSTQIVHQTNYAAKMHPAQKLRRKVNNR